MALTRRFVLPAALGAVAALLAACGSSPGTSTSSSAASTDSGSSSAAAGQLLNIWYVNVLPSYPAWGRSMDQFKANAAKLNYRATAVGPPKVDGPAMIGMIEQAIADKADGIITCDIDPDTFKDTIAKAQAAGIVMVTIGCTDTISDYSIGTDNTNFGETAADVIAEKAGADAQVVIISTDQTTPNQVAQVKGFEAQIAAKHPGIKVVGWESDKSDSSVAAQKITASVAANPGLSAVWCVEGQCPAGVQTGLREAGKNPGDIYALGIDDVETTLKAIEAGWVSASINQCFFDSTPLAVALIRAKKEGTASTQQSWSVATDLITKDRLPYEGCPADATPTLS